MNCIEFNLIRKSINITIILNILLIYSVFFSETNYICFCMHKYAYISPNKSTETYKVIDNFAIHHYIVQGFIKFPPSCFHKIEFQGLFNKRWRESQSIFKSFLQNVGKSFYYCRWVTGGHGHIIYPVNVLNK